MSGGYFTGVFFMQANAEKIEEYLNSQPDLMFSDTADRIRSIQEELITLQEKLKLVDLLIEGDISETTFIERL